MSSSYQHPIPDYASPRPSLASPGLTHRGKTPRSAGGFGDDAQHTHFQFNEFALDRQPSIPEEEAAYNNDKDGKPGAGLLRSPFSLSMRGGSGHGHGHGSSPRRQMSMTSGQGGPSAIKRLLLGAAVSALLFGVLASTGFFDGRGGASVGDKESAAGAGGKKGGGLRGASMAVVDAGDGTKVFVREAAVDHHKARVLVVPSLEPFARRNVHHFDKHDPGGRLLPPNAKQTARAQRVERAEREDAALHVEEAELHEEDRRVVAPPAEDVLNLFPSAEERAKQALVLPEAFRTTGVVKRFHSITGVDKYHHFDVNDYFGSSVTRMGADPATGLTTLAVGAPGALENSGMVYFLTLQKNGQVEGYTYLTNADNSLGDFWTSNVALGWTVENIGDLDGDGVDDLAVGAIGYPHGSSLGAVYILFLTPEHEIKGYKVITTGEAGFTPVLKENSCFGSSIARLGDLDGDGVTELAVGAMGLGKQRGGVFILYMNKDGSVKKSVQISSLFGWDHRLNVEDQFGHAVRAIGDLDGDGITELAVGGDGFPSGEFYGAVWVLFLGADGGVKRWRRLDELDAQLQPESLFGGSIDTLGDLDGDGMPELVIGAPGANDFKGDAFVISLDKDARVKAYKSLVDDLGVLADSIKEEDEFAWSLCNVGDLDGDGIPELAIGAETSPSDKNYGSLHVVFFSARGV